MLTLNSENEYTAFLQEKAGGNIHSCEDLGKGFPDLIYNSYGWRPAQVPIFLEAKYLRPNRKFTVEFSSPKQAMRFRRIFNMFPDLTYVLVYWQGYTVALNGGRALRWYRSEGFIRPEVLLDHADFIDEAENYQSLFAFLDGRITSLTRCQRFIDEVGEIGGAAG